MRIVERYISRQIATTAGITLLIMLIAFVLERTIRLTRDVNPSDLPLELAAGLLLSRVPEILGIALPPALFAGVLLTFQRLLRDNELDVIYASGVGLFQLMKPLLLLIASAGLFSILVFWFLLPHSKYYYRSLMHEVTQAPLDATPKEGTFLHIGDNVLFLREGGERGAGHGNIFFFEPGETGSPFVTTANSGAFEISQGRDRLYLRAKDGQRLSIANENRGATLLAFEEVRSLLLSVNQEKFRARGRDKSELTLLDLLTADGGQEPRIRAELHTKIVRVLIVCLIPFAALPLALTFPVSRQWMGIGLGAFMVLAVDQALIYGDTLVGQGRISPLAGIWSVVGGLIVTVAALSTITVLTYPQRPSRLALLTRPSSGKRGSRVPGGSARAAR